MKDSYDVGVVGAGIVGTAIAYNLSQVGIQDVPVLEKIPCALATPCTAAPPYAPTGIRSDQPSNICPSALKILIAIASGKWWN